MGSGVKKDLRRKPFATNLSIGVTTKEFDIVLCRSFHADRADLSQPPGWVESRRQCATSSNTIVANRCYAARRAQSERFALVADPFFAADWPPIEGELGSERWMGWSSDVTI